MVDRLVDDQDEFAGAGDDPRVLTGAGKAVVVKKQLVVSSFMQEGVPAGYELFHVFADFGPVGHYAGAYRE